MYRNKMKQENHVKKLNPLGAYKSFVNVKQSETPKADYINKKYHSRKY